MKKDEQGYIVVEVLILFIPFILAMMSITMLITVVAMQSRVHYALTQTANEISILSYLDHNASSVTDRSPGNFDSAMDFIDSIATLFPLGSIDRSMLLAYFNFEESFNEDFIRGIFENYLADDFRVRMDNEFSFENSVLDGDRLILRVDYGITFTFGPLMPGPTLYVRQTAATRLWRHGHTGEGFNGLSYYLSRMPDWEPRYLWSPW